MPIKTLACRNAGNVYTITSYIWGVQKQCRPLLKIWLSKCRLLPLYFPRDEHEEEVAISKLPADVGDENGETVIDERKIRIQALPNKPPPRSFPTPLERPSTDLTLLRRLVNSWLLQSLQFIVSLLFTLLIAIWFQELESSWFVFGSCLHVLD